MTTCHNCDDAHLAAEEIKTCQKLIPRTPGRALDVGAGDSGAGREILRGYDYTGIDKAGPFVNQIVHQGDIFDDTPPWFADHLWDVVLVKRMLCQLSSEDMESVGTLWRLLKSGGHLLVCEPFREPRDRIQAARRASGPHGLLPRPKSGGNGIDDAPLEKAFGKPLVTRLVAPDYTIWTRLVAPMVLGRELSYDEEFRMAYPTYPDEVRERYAFYRAKLYVK